MALQTNYNERMAVAFLGQIADLAPNVLISRDVETEDGIGFGVPVAQGTDDRQVDLLSAASDEIVGISVREQNAEGDKTPVTKSITLMRKCVLWVEASGAVNAGDPVFATVADGTFTAADAGTSGSVQINDARWEDSAADGELARIRFDLDGGVTAGAA